MLSTSSSSEGPCVFKDKPDFALAKGSSQYPYGGALVFLCEGALSPRELYSIFLQDLAIAMACRRVVSLADT